MCGKKQEGQTATRQFALLERSRSGLSSPEFAKNADAQEATAHQEQAQWFRNATQAAPAASVYHGPVVRTVIGVRDCAGHADISNAGEVGGEVRSAQREQSPCRTLAVLRSRRERVSRAPVTGRKEHGPV